jgi:hypothetical protein
MNMGPVLEGYGAMDILSSEIQDDLYLQRSIRVIHASFSIKNSVD